MEQDIEALIAQELANLPPMTQEEMRELASNLDFHLPASKSSLGSTFSHTELVDNMFDFSDIQMEILKEIQKQREQIGMIHLEEEEVLESNQSAAVSGNESNGLQHSDVNIASQEADSTSENIAMMPEVDNNDEGDVSTALVPHELERLNNLESYEVGNISSTAINPQMDCADSLESSEEGVISTTLDIQSLDYTNRLKATVEENISPALAQPQLDNSLEASSELLSTLQSNHFTEMEPYYSEIQLEKLSQEHASLNIELQTLNNAVSRQNTMTSKLTFKLDKLLLLKNSVSASLRKARDEFLYWTDKCKSLPNEIISIARMGLDKQRHRLSKYEGDISDIQENQETISKKLESRQEAILQSQASIASVNANLLEQFEDYETRINGLETDIASLNILISVQETERNLYYKQKTNLLAAIETKRLEKAIIIQKNWRRYAQVKRFKKICSFLVRLQSRIRTFLQVRRINILRIEIQQKLRIESAVFIQKIVRGWLLRKRMKETKQFLMDTDDHEFDLNPLLEDIASINLMDLDFQIPEHFPEVYIPTVKAGFEETTHKEENENVAETPRPASTARSDVSVSSRMRSLANVAQEWGFSNSETVERMYQRQQKLSSMNESESKRKMLQDPMMRLKLFQKQRHSSTNVKLPLIHPTQNMSKVSTTRKFKSEVLPAVSVPTPKLIQHQFFSEELVLPHLK